MYTRATTPPACGDYAFIPGETATLHVPEGCKNAYAAANVWMTFANIKENVETGIESVASLDE